MSLVLTNGRSCSLPKTHVIQTVFFLLRNEKTVQCIRVNFDIFYITTGNSWENSKSRTANEILSSHTRTITAYPWTGVGFWTSNLPALVNFSFISKNLLSVSRVTHPNAQNSILNSNVEKTTNKIPNTSLHVNFEIAKTPYYTIGMLTPTASLVFAVQPFHVLNK